MADKLDKTLKIIADGQVSLPKLIAELRNENRRRFDQRQKNFDRQQKHAEETDRRMRETDGRIDKLVVAIGQFIRQQS